MFEPQRHLGSSHILFKNLQVRMKDIFTRGTISKGHFHKGHLLWWTFSQGQNLEDIFSRDENPGTFRQGHFFQGHSSMYSKKRSVVAVMRGVVRYNDNDLLHSQNIFLSTRYTFKSSLRLMITAFRTMKNDNVCYRLISDSVVEISSILSASSR